MPAPSDSARPPPQKTLYGRRKGPRLSAHQTRLVETLLPQLELDLRENADPREYFAADVEEVWFEIGFGAGEHLLWQAQHNPNVGIIGAEPYESGVAKLLSRLDSLSPGARPLFPSPASAFASGGGAEHAQACEAEGVRRMPKSAPPPSRLAGVQPARLDTSPAPPGARPGYAGEGNSSVATSCVNSVERGKRDIPARIRLYAGDARDIIGALPDASLARVFLLFPDPWPKKRHHKRRFIQTETLDALARVMKPGAELRFASDDADHVAWTIERILAHDAFAWLAQRPSDWLSRSSDWPATRYEHKALHGLPAFFRFRRLGTDSAALLQTGPRQRR